MTFTKDELTVLHEKLELVLSQARVHSAGVDVWLAPGGTVDEDLLLLDPDDGAVDELLSVYNKICVELGVTPQQFD